MEISLYFNELAMELNILLKYLQTSVNYIGNTSTFIYLSRRPPSLSEVTLY